MAKRDINRRETKKPKKGEKKPIVIGEIDTAPVVEVVRKHRKAEDDEAL